MRIVEIIHNIEEEGDLWEFEDDISDSHIVDLYRMFQQSVYEDFEEYMISEHVDMNCSRVFAEVILIGDE